MKGYYSSGILRTQSNTYTMNKLVDKRVRMNLAPFKRSPFMTEAFAMAAKEQGWTETEIALAINQTKELSLDGKYDILANYCKTYGEDAVCTQEDVKFMLYFLGHHSHYLCTKPIECWDEYDYSNFNSLKRKATSSLKGVFAHFDESVEEKDKYELEHKPTKHFDTLEEALEAVPVGTESTINIYALWIKN